MPDITNPQLIRFANEKIRPTADALIEAYRTCKSFVSEWDALNLGARIPRTADEIVDGSRSDGRKVLTANRANALYDVASAFIADFEANTAKKFGDVVNVNVNGGSRVG